MEDGRGGWERGWETGMGEGMGEGDGERGVGEGNGRWCVDVSVYCLSGCDAASGDRCYEGDDGDSGHYKKVRCDGDDDFGDTDDDMPFCRWCPDQLR